MRTNINYPLMRELQQMGILTEETTPQLIGPFKTNTEAFAGDTSGQTKALAETPVGSLMFAVTIATSSGTDNTLAALAEDTHYTISGDTITWISDQSANQVLVHYAY